MRKIAMPAIDMPFAEYGASPAMNALEKDLWAWLESRGLIASDAVRAHVARTMPYYATALSYPRADFAHLLYINRFMALGFVIDDQLDDAIATRDVATVGAKTSRLIAVSKGAEAPASHLERAVAELNACLCAGRSPSWRQALIDNQAIWFGTCLTDALLSQARESLSLMSYALHRMQGVGMAQFFPFSEYVSDVELSHEIRMLPAMAHARETCALWIGLYNDICSYEKEQAVGYPLNAVLIEREQRAVPMQQAVDSIIAALNGVLAQFQMACAIVPQQLEAVAGKDPGLLDDVEKVMESYRQLIRGNFDYHLNAPRYIEAVDYARQTAALEKRPDWSIEAT